MTSKNILILSSNTGGGHWSAAKALEDSLLNEAPQELLVTITQVLEEASLLSRKAAELYNFLLRDHQHLMRYYFWTVNKLKPNESKLLFKASMEYGFRLFERMMPSAIISVHPMTQHFFGYVLKRLNLKGRVPLMTVVTDPYDGFWEGWACEDVSRYYVASDAAKDQLIQFGVDENKIIIHGMPVHSRFHPVSAEEKQHLKTQLGLEPDRFTVFVNAGWIGGGNIPLIYETLLREAGQAALDIQVIFLAGQNEDLMQQAYAMAQQVPFPVKVLGYTTQIDSLMQASDIMISKLGGLTTFEALSCRLPIVADLLTPPMPQEAKTAAFLETTGAGLMLKKPDQIVSVVKSLIDSPQRYQSLCDTAVRYGRPGASDRIARDILSFVEQTTQAVKETIPSISERSFG